MFCHKTGFVEAVDPPTESQGVKTWASGQGQFCTVKFEESSTQMILAKI